MDDPATLAPAPAGQVPAAQGGPLAHADDPVAGGLQLAGAAAVVGDLELQGVGPVRDGDARPRGARMLEGVGERLLHDAIGGEVDARGKGTRSSRRLDLDREAGL